MSETEEPILQVMDGLPPGFLEAAPEDLAQLLGGPTLIQIPGEREPPLLVSTLLHGNEITGLQAVQQVLRCHHRHGALRLPRALALFVGNVAAAREGVRRLPEQPDFNRVWPGTPMGDCAETRMAAEVVARMRSRGCFASIDIHNNTGLNPHYACINVLAAPWLQLARAFSRTVVYFTRPPGVQSLALARVAPATTLECGQSGSPGAAEHAAEMVETVLHWSHIPETAPRDVEVYHTVGAVRIPESVSFRFDDEPGETDLVLPAQLERWNFHELEVGTLFAQARTDTAAFFRIEDNAGREAAAEFLYRDGGAIRLRCPVMPAMLTRSRSAIRQDVLGYFMERYRFDADS